MNIKWGCIVASLVLCCFFSVSVLEAQECEIKPVIYPTFSLKNFGKISDVAENIGKDPNFVFEVVLFDYPQSRNKAIAYYIGIDVKGGSHLNCINVDSIYYSKVFDSSFINIDSFSLKKDSCREFYISRCKTSMSYDASKAILIYNYLTKKFVYFYSSDGRMLEALDLNGKYPFLNHAYKTIRRIFQSLKLFQMQSFFSV